MVGTTDKVFISYSHVDQKFARKLTIWLAKTLDIGVWIDMDDIPVGVKWSSAIQDGLEQCEVMIVIITPEAMESVNVEDEWQYFLDQDKPVVPILLKSAQIPYQLRRIQYIDFSMREELNESLRLLITELRQHLKPLDKEGQGHLNKGRALERKVRQATRSTESKAATQEKARLRRGQIINAILALVLVGLIGGVVGFFIALQSQAAPIQVLLRDGAGNVTITDPEGNIQVISNLDSAAVPEGSTIQSGDSVLELVGDSGIAVVQPNSEIGVAGLNTGVNLDLVSGNVSVDTEVGEGRVNTPYGINIDVEGRSVDVQIDEDTDTVRADCYEGSCTISNDAGQVRELEQGNSITFSGIEQDFDTAAINAIPGSIAFVTYRHGSPEIYLINPDGSNETRLTDNFYGDLDPAWSPDGSLIAFVTKQEGPASLAVMKPDGSDVKILNAGNSVDAQPAWSSDSQHIVFSSNKVGNEDIYIIDRDGENLTRLTEYRGQDYDPTWSPNGTRIAFVSTRSGKPEIWIMNTDGTELENLIPSDIAEEDPTWSPDSTRIAFTSRQDGSDLDIVVLTLETNEIINVTNSGVDSYEPAWSPDSTQLIFTSAGFSKNDIYIISALGGESTNITENGRGSDEKATWLPIMRAGA
jgi:hypothetical protein